MRPPKGISLYRTASVELSCVKISQTIWSVGPYLKRKGKIGLIINEKMTISYISPMRGAARSQSVLTLCGTFDDPTDVINCAKFHVSWLRAFDLAKTRKSHVFRKVKSFLILCLALPRSHVILTRCFD
jgi:hypothetical protein